MFKQNVFSYFHIRSQFTFIDQFYTKHSIKGCNCKQSDIGVAVTAAIYRRFIDTGGKSTSGIVTTGGKFTAGVTAINVDIGKDVTTSMEEGTLKTQNPKCRLYWCLIEFIDWRNSQS
jgi:hypothetical protein